MSNWELEINTDDLITTIEYGSNMSFPTGKVTGRLFYKQGFDIPVYEMNQNTYDKVGVYEQTYMAKWLCFETSKTEIITVIDSVAPTLTLSENEQGEIICKAIDAYDGDLTDQIQTVIEGDQIIYFVRDSSGNTCSESRTIEKQTSKESPVIILNGPKEITIRKWSIYHDLGAKAIDADGNDISDYIVMNSNVDITAVGSYNVTYTVIDDNDLQSQITRIVNIAPIEESQYELTNIGNGKVVHLTFDDGPSQYTPQLLEILKKYNVKATFFVVGNGSTKYIKDIVEQGHSIGMHSVNHSYKTIYASKEAFFEDLYKMQSIIKDKTGVETYLMRFPGGSSNTVSKSYKVGIMTELSKAVEEAGFVYFDWNVSSGDAGGAKSSEAVFNNVIKGLQQNKTSVVLQHDTKAFSVDAVEQIIQWGLANGYAFAPLDETSNTAHHPINN